MTALWETPALLEPAAEEDNSTLSLEEIREQARAEAYQEGLARAEQETAARLAQLDAYLQVLGRSFYEHNERLAEELAKLAGRIAKSLVRRELRTEPETIMALVRDSVAALNAGVRKVYIHLHPENARRLREMIDNDSTEQSWQIIEDPLVSHSDCKVSCEDAEINADLQTRIDLIITRFLGDQRSESRQ